MNSRLVCEERVARVEGRHGTWSVVRVEGRHGTWSVARVEGRHGTWSVARVEGHHGTWSVVRVEGRHGAWSVMLREEHLRVRVFEIRVLKNIFGPERDEVAGEWRKLHSEELYDVPCSPNCVLVIKRRRMRWARHVARMRDRTVVYKVWVRRSEGKRPL